MAICTDRPLFSYYDPVGNRQYEHRDNNLGNDDFGYDANSQLTDFTRSGTLATNTTADFTFDEAGNWKKLIKDSVTTNYTINGLNQYATITGVANPTYDDNGNLLTYDGATFTYDSMNRLTQAVKGGTTARRSRGQENILALGVKVRQKRSECQDRCGSNLPEPFIM